jgi:hypothetical protein
MRVKSARPGWVLCRFNEAFWVWHKAEDSACRVTHAGYILLGSIWVGLLPISVLGIVKYKLAT